MDIEKLAGNARGQMYATVLEKHQDGYVPPGVIQWSPGKPPVDYLREDEQPHFLDVGFERAFKIRAPPEINLRKESRVPLDEVQEGIMHDGQIGYLSADDPYSNILLVTDQRILILVGKESDDLKVEFGYDAEGISVNPGSSVVSVGDIDYCLTFWNRGRGAGYLDEASSFDVEGTYNREKTSVGEQSSIESSRSSSKISGSRTPVDLSDLLSLTPRGLEEYVADVWRARGYTCHLTQGSRDGGIDVVADDENERMLLQVKRYSKQNVGVETVQRTAGLLVDEEFTASKVAIVSTSGFTDDARSRARRIDSLTLVNGTELVDRGNKAEVGTQTEDGDYVYSHEVFPEQILSVLNGPEPKKTCEIIRELNANQKPVIRQLKTLAKEGEIQGKNVAPDRYIWYTED
jgi:hypothetical protein